MAIGGGLWAAILGYCFTFYNAQVQEQRKARLERVNQQLKDLYGPLLACVTATKSAYEAMVRQHSPDGSRQALQSALLARPYGPEAHAFRLWMTSVLQPLNERAAAIVQGGFSLLEGVALEPQLLQLVAHVSASRVVLERWAQGELATGSAISYPDKLEGMVRQEFARLKARQAELLGVTTPKAERLANKHAECSAPMHAPSSACDTSSGHGPDSVEGCVEGDSSRLVPEDPDSDIEDRDEALQPDLTEAERSIKVSGEDRAARDKDNTYHGRKCKIAHLIDHLPQELRDAFLDDAVQPRVEAISERAVLASLLFGLLVRGLFTIHVADPLDLHDQPVYTDIPVSQAAIPDLSCRNLFLQLVRGLPGNGANTRPNAAVAAVLAAHPDLRARLAAIPRHPSDTNMVDHVDPCSQVPASPWVLRQLPCVLSTAVVMFLRPKPAAPPADPPRMGRHMGAVNPLAHLDAEWLGVDPGKTNMATVAHEERSAAGTVVSVWQRSLTAGQYYRDSGITRQAQATKKWLAQVKPQLTALSRVGSKPSSLASYRRFADTVLATYDAMWAEVSKPRWANAKFRLYCGKQRVVARFWSKLIKQAKQRWPDRVLALACGAAGFSGSGSIGCRGVPVSQMLKEALRQFPAGRVVMVDEFRTSRVSSAYSHPSEALPGQPPESFRWLRPVYSSAKRSQVRGLMCSTSNNIRFYDRDVSAALNIRRCAVGPGPRPTELCYWDGRPAMPKPGRPGQEWVYLRDKALLRKWRRKWRR
ncbi:hypothetical protein QJQ45_009333 [Haematococcus lacustris]|nr:hypothetical protein QJQ45_009333 [Haematococcus lacustris]